MGLLPENGNNRILKLYIICKGQEEMATLTKSGSKKLDRIIKAIDDNIDSIEHPKQNDYDLVLQGFIDRLRANLEKDDLNASYSLSQSIDPLPTQYSNGVVKIRVEMNDYWRDVDEGAKPKPLTKANLSDLTFKISKWVLLKPTLSEMAKKKKSLSYLIAKSILRKGTIKRFGYKGSGFLTKELPGFKESIVRVMEQQLKIQ